MYEHEAVTNMHSVNVAAVSHSGLSFAYTSSYLMPAPSKSGTRSSATVFSKFAQFNPWIRSLHLLMFIFICKASLQDVMRLLLSGQCVCPSLFLCLPGDHPVRLANTTAGPVVPLSIGM